MLQKTNCHKVIFNPPVHGLVSAVHSILAKDNYSLEQTELPALHSVFPSLAGEEKVVKTFPSHRTTPSVDDVVMYIHSSGSTGFPKPIPQTHRILLQWCTSGKSLSSYTADSH